MWEHSRSINRVMLGLPSVGHCTLHGLDRHVCYMYTASEDRTICMWNIATCAPIRSFTSKALRQAVFMCITQSPRHLIVGTSDASVVVFTKEEVCERGDIHACNTPGATKQGCLQVTLRLSERGSLRLQSGEMPVIRSVLCTGVNHSFSHIWAADSAGQLSVWENPVLSGINFKPIAYWVAHGGGINDMAATRYHLITIADDGYLIVHDMVRMVPLRTMHFVTWALDKGLISNPDIHRRLKCLQITESTDGVTSGTMVIGTNYGEVVACSIGTTL
jgi:hypothetical protein